LLSFPTQEFIAFGFSDSIQVSPDCFVRRIGDKQYLFISTAFSLSTHSQIQPLHKKTLGLIAT